MIGKFVRRKVTKSLYFRSASESDSRSRWSLSSMNGGGPGAGEKTGGGPVEFGGEQSNFGPPNITPIGGVPNLKVPPSSPTIVTGMVAPPTTIWGH